MTESDESSISADKVLKRQKKRARREAKLMLEIEAVKKDLKKAQKKQSKAQARLEKRSTALHTLEARLAELRAPGPQAASDTTAQSATDEQLQAQPEVESSIVPDEGKEPASSDHERPGEIISLTDQILPSPHIEGEEAIPLEGTVVIKDATGGEAMKDDEVAVERAPAPTTPGKTNAPKTAAARTSTATKRPASRSQRTSKPSSDAGHEG